jgi:hypothetical protein
MLAEFCLRLSCGLMGSLLVLAPAVVPTRFYRVHFLTALGLTVLAVLTLGDPGSTASGTGWPWRVGLLALLFLGSLAWSLERKMAGIVFAIASTLALMGTLVVDIRSTAPPEQLPWNVAGEVTSSLLLGAATSAMLMGHSYLIAPAMSLSPLLRLLALLGIGLAARGALAGIELWSWTGEHSLARLNEVTLLLPVRWALGIIGPGILAAMAWQTARMRSTQSATGILYVVVIFCFLGELMGLLLERMTGRVL